MPFLGFDVYLMTLLSIDTVHTKDWKRGAVEVANKFMTADEVAEYLRLTTAKIYRLSQKGMIPAYKFGREWRFKGERIGN